MSQKLTKKQLKQMALLYSASTIISVDLDSVENAITYDDFEYFPGQDTYSPRRISAGVTLDW